MARPKLDDIEKQFKTGESFSLTETQYFLSTGLNIPKNENYLKNKSAVAHKAHQYGYKVRLVEKTINFEKEKEQ